MKIRNIALTTFPVAIAVGTMSLAVPAHAATGTTVIAKCSHGSLANLQVQREDTGKLSVDFGVDMARHIAGVPWKATATDNGKAFLSTTTKTISDGSWSITRTFNPLAGSNKIVANAKNLQTGETCTVTATV